jgi:glycosyltransferase involved in cell wall biosynthesis
MLLRHKIDTFQVNGYFESMLLPVLGILRRTSIYTMHGPFETEIYRWYRNPERFFPRLISRICLRFASKIICVSETVGNTARPVLPSKKVRVICNWVATGPAQLKKSFTLHRPARLLFAGRLEEYKGVHLVIEAIRQLPDVLFTVVGDGNYRESLQRLGAGLNVQFEGFRPDPSSYYAASDIFVNPSLGPEGLPLTSLEAMGHGLPCLFSDLPVHAEITQRGFAGTLFCRGDATDLRTKLVSLLADEQQRRETGSRAVETVAAKYSYAVAAEHYLQVFGISTELC